MTGECAVVELAVVGLSGHSVGRLVRRLIGIYTEASPAKPTRMPPNATTDIVSIFI